MPDKKLPESYKGYSTKELLDLWERIKTGRGTRSTLAERYAMQDLLREYKISPIHQWESRATNTAAGK